MDEQEQYTIRDVTDEQRREQYNAALATVLNEPRHEKPISARAALKKALADWASKYDLPLGEFDVILDTDDDDDLRIVLPDLTIDAEGEVVVKRREYAVTASYTVEVTITVTASSEDEARDIADDELRGAQFDVEWVDGGEVTDVDYYGITEVDEQ